MESEADLRKQVEELQAQLDIFAWVISLLVPITEGTLLMMVRDTSPGARNAFAQHARARFRDIEAKIKVEPLEPPKTET